MAKERQTMGKGKKVGTKRCYHKVLKARSCSLRLLFADEQQIGRAHV